MDTPKKGVRQLVEKGKGHWNCSLFVQANLVFLVLSLLITGCSQSPSETSTIKETPAHETPASTPIKVHLSISKAPALNEKATLTYTISSSSNAANTTAEIKFTTARVGIFPAPFPIGAVLVSGNLTWEGDLKAGEPISLSAEVVFKETGKWAIELNAHHVENENSSWGDIDIIYLTVGVDRGEFGWPPTGPVKIQKTRPGEVPGVPSSQEEPPIENLPPPPSVSQNGTIIKK